MYNNVPSVMVTLYFSKTMNASFHCSDIAFQSARSSASLLVLPDAVCAVVTTVASRNLTFYAPKVHLSSYGEGSNVCAIVIVDVITKQEYYISVLRNNR
jgi:hypothetical protein